MAASGIHHTAIHKYTNTHKKKKIKLGNQTHHDHLQGWLFLVALFVPNYFSRSSKHLTYSVELLTYLLGKVEGKVLTPP